MYGSTYWDYQLRAGYQGIVIGYDINDGENYLNVNVDQEDGYLFINSIIGNTGQYGQWYFGYTPTELKPEQLCFKWANEQDRILGESLVTSLPSCPCSKAQALYDWRFLFAYWIGLSSDPNCATLLFSRMQSTIECCYDEDDGSLIIGPKKRGTVKLFNPLFHPAEYRDQDKVPYEQCCNGSQRCQIFYKHRPSHDCDLYEKPLIGIGLHETKSCITNG